MAKRWVHGGRRRIVTELERARTSFTAALRAFESAIELNTDLEAPPTPSEMETTRIDGWCEAVRVVAATALLDGHEGVRVAVIAELERRMNEFCDAAAERRKATDAVDPQVGSTGKMSTRASTHFPTGRA